MKGSLKITERPEGRLALVSDLQSVGKLKTAKHLDKLKESHVGKGFGTNRDLLCSCGMTGGIMGADRSESTYSRSRTAS